MTDTLSIAIMFADVSGSTSLYEKMGNAVALQAVDECVRVMKEVTQDFEGAVIKTIGDEVMSRFSSADAAMQAAIEMQIRIQALPEVQEVKRAIRVGFHWGPVIEESNDVFGDAVNVAARVAGLAKAGQVLTTEATAHHLSPFLRHCIRALHAFPLKGKDEQIQVFEALWHHSDELTTVAGLTQQSAPKQAQRLRLTWQNTTFEVGELPVQLGRDTSNEVVITDRLASRQHARIERRRDKFVLIDQSSNGTFVRIEGDADVVLRREELTLRGQGLITFGHSADQGTDQALHFNLSQD